MSLKTLDLCQNFQIHRVRLVDYGCKSLIPVEFAYAV
jgi:hypothetical protein